MRSLLKKRYILAILISTFSFAGIQADDFPDQKQVASDNLIISGTVTEKSIRQPGSKGEIKPVPVRDVAVFLENNIYSAITDKNGNFSLQLQHNALPGKNELTLTAVKEGYALTEINIPAGQSGTFKIELLKTEWKKVILSGNVTDEQGRKLTDAQLVFSAAGYAFSLKTDNKGVCSRTIMLPAGGMTFTIQAAKYGYNTLTAKINSRNPAFNLILVRQEVQTVLTGTIYEQTGDILLPLQEATIKIESGPGAGRNFSRTVTSLDNGSFSTNLTFYKLNPYFAVTISKPHYAARTLELNLLEMNNNIIILERLMYDVNFSGITSSRMPPSGNTSVLGNVSLALAGDGFTVLAASAADGSFSCRLKVPRINPWVKITASRAHYKIMEKSWALIDRDKKENIILEPELLSNEVRLKVWGSNPFFIGDGGAWVNITNTNVKVSVDTAFPEAAAIPVNSYYTDLNGVLSFKLPLPRIIPGYNLMLSKNGYHNKSVYYENQGGIQDYTIALDPLTVTKRISGKVYLKDEAVQISTTRQGLQIKMEIPDRAGVSTQTAYDGSYEFYLSHRKISDPRLTLSLDLTPSQEQEITSISVARNASAVENPVDLFAATKNVSLLIRGSLDGSQFAGTTLRVNRYGYLNDPIEEESFLITRENLSSFQFPVQFWKALNALTLVFSKPGYQDKIIRLEKITLPANQANYSLQPLNGIKLDTGAVTRLIKGTVYDEGKAVEGVLVSAGNNSTLTAADGAFTLALITAKSNPRMQIVFTSEKYKPVSRWLNLNYLQPVVINLEKKSRLITIAGKVELPEEERSSLSDYNEFTVNVDYGNKQYRTQTRDLGAFAISFTRQAVDAAVCSLKIGNPGYDDIRETTSLPAWNDADVFMEKQYFPKLKKFTCSLSLAVQGYENLPLDDVVYNIYSPVNTGFCFLGGKLDKHFSGEISLPVSSPDLKIQLSAPYYEQKTTNINLSRTQNITVNLKPVDQNIFIAGRIMAGNLSPLKNRLARITIDTLSAETRTDEGGNFSIIMQIPKIAAAAVISVPGDAYYTAISKIILLTPGSNRYENNILIAEYIMIPGNIETDLFRQLPTLTERIYSEQPEPLSCGTLEMTTHNFTRTFNINEASHTVNNEFMVPLAFPEINLSLSAPQCVPVTVTYDLSRTNAINPVLSAYYNPGLPVSLYTPGNLNSGSWDITAPAPGSVWYSVPANQPGRIRAGTSDRAAGDVSVSAFRETRHLCSKDGKARILVNLRWRFNSPEYIPGTAACILDILLKVDKSVRSVLAKGDFMLYWPAPGPDRKGHADFSPENLAAYVNAAAENPGDTAELLLVLEQEIKKGQWITIAPGFKITASDVPGSRGAAVTGYIDGILIVEGDNGINRLMDAWLTGGGAYQDYTSYPPYTAVLQCITDFAFNQAMDRITGWADD